MAVEFIDTFSDKKRWMWRPPSHIPFKSAMRARLPISFYPSFILQEDDVAETSVNFRIFQEGVRDITQYLFISITIVSVQDAYHLTGSMFDAFVHAIINTSVGFTDENVDPIFVLFQHS